MDDPAVLLMTDIVDSTKLVESLGNRAAADLWAAHDRLVRDLAPRWGATLLHRSDGVFLRFPSVADAVEFAIAYHAGLLAPFRARAGIHVGPLEVRAASDEPTDASIPATVAGIAIPTTARIMSLATGGQTLLSQDALALLPSPAARRVVGHGHWRLKGIEEPVELFEVGAADAPFAPPADAPKAYRVVRRNERWMPRREVPHSLPAERNSFVGRRLFLDGLAQRIDSAARLISVVGTGGTGKTRLVQHFGWQHLGDFDGGVWYCDLSQATTFDGLCLAVAQGLGIPLGKSEPVEQLGNSIAGHGKCLVVLDNFEQVAEHAQKTLGRWLDRAVSAQFVVTTRIVLGLDGEDVLMLPPLGQPEAIALFTQRAEAAQHDFVASGANADHLRELVDLLDGLPLAIELAAARIRVFGLANLVARMRDRFKLLISGGGRPTRQATLRATFDWSWDLLSDVEKAGLAQLGVFEGGFDIASAEAVLDVGDASAEVVDVLQSLVEKSWVLQRRADRFGLLKTIQEYAAEQLDADGRFPRSGLHMRMDAEQRHWEHFGALDEVAATAGRCVEIDNLAAAARRSTARMEPHAAASALSSVWHALKLCGPYRTAIGLSADVLAVPGLSGTDRASAELVLGNALQYCGRVVEASACYALALEMARGCGSLVQEARTLCAMGEQQVTASQYDEARVNLERSLSIAREIGDQRLECASLNAIGNLHLNRGEPALAQVRYEAALTLATRLGDRRWQGGLLGNLGGVHHALGRVIDAQQYYEQAIVHAQEVGDRRWENNARSNFGLLLSETDQFDRARVELEQAMTGARALGHLRLECIVASNLGITCDKNEDRAAARVHYERAMDIAKSLDDQRTLGQTLGYYGLFLVRQGEPASGKALLVQGESLLQRAHDQLSLATILAQRAEADWLLDDRMAARAQWDRAVAAASSLDLVEHSVLNNTIVRIGSLLDGGVRA